MNTKEMTTGNQVADKSSCLPSSNGGVETITILFLLALIFVYIQFPTFSDPYYWDSAYAADTADRILVNSLDPRMGDFKDPGHPVLFQELYALGWLVLGRQVWWPHAVALFFSFGALLYTYRLGVWVANPTVGLACALLLMLDPLFLAQSGTIYLAAPSFGLATATLYYLATAQPRQFALAGSLTALSYLPAVNFLFVLIGIGCLRHRRHDRRLIVWYFLPALVFFAWLVFHKLSYGYFVSHPDYWSGKQRSFLLNEEGLHHIYLNVTEVFLRVWRVPFTALVLLGILSALHFYVFQHRPRGTRRFLDWQALFRSQHRRTLLFIFLGTTFLHLPLMSVATGPELLGRYYLFLLPSFFVLALDFLYAARKQLFVLVVVLFALNLHAHWYDPKEPWRYNFEETLLYREALRAETEAAQYITREFPNSTVVASWPHVRQLRDPLLQYVKEGLPAISPGEVKPDSSIELVYYSTHSLVQERSKLLDLIEQYAGRPIQTFRYGSTKITILKAGQNLCTPDYHYRFLAAVESPSQVRTNSTFEVEVIVRNLGRKIWRRSSDIAVSYLWEQEGQVIPDSSNIRTPFEEDVFWGDTIPVVAKIRAPDKPGNYELRIDLVHEKVTWFKSQGNEPLKLQIEAMGPYAAEICQIENPWVFPMRQPCSHPIFR